MDGIILAALALLSVPVLLVVILVKVCGLENKVTDLALKLTVIDFTQRHKDTENIFSIKISVSLRLCVLFNQKVYSHDKYFFPNACKPIR